MSFAVAADTQRHIDQGDERADVATTRLAWTWAAIRDGKSETERLVLGASRKPRTLPVAEWIEGLVGIDVKELVRLVALGEVAGASREQKQLADSLILMHVRKTIVKAAADEADEFAMGESFDRERFEAQR